MKTFLNFCSTLAKGLWFIIKSLWIWLIWPILKWVGGTIKSYPEILVIPFMIILWYSFMLLVYYIDPKAGTFDTGVFQLIIFTAIQFSIYLSLTWLMLKIFNGTVRKFIKNDFKNLFKDLDSWQKIKFSFCVFGFVLLCFVLLARVLMVTPMN